MNVTITTHTEYIYPDGTKTVIVGSECRPLTYDEAWSLLYHLDQTPPRSLNDVDNRAALARKLGACGKWS
jgi:hypothetical protein